MQATLCNNDGASAAGESIKSLNRRCDVDLSLSRDTKARKGRKEVANNSFIQLVPMAQVSADPRWIGVNPVLPQFFDDRPDIPMDRLVEMFPDHTGLLISRQLIVMFEDISEHEGFRLVILELRNFRRDHQFNAPQTNAFQIAVIRPFRLRASR